MNAPAEVLELIHGEIDGELSSAERAELGRRLLAEPALRIERERLRHVCAALDGLPSEAPPAGLRASIMESLPASPPGRTDRDVHLLRGRPALRVAAAFAGGLLATAVAFQLALHPELPDVRDLAGTIADRAAGPSELDLHAPGVSGVVRLERHPEGSVLVAEVVVERPVQVIARLGTEQHTLGFPVALQEGVQVSEARFGPRAGRGEVWVSLVDVATGDVLQRATLRPSVHD